MYDDILVGLKQSEDDIAFIKSHVSEADKYDQLAEEAAELAQAASKMARVIRGSNPTPNGKIEAMKDLIEEYTDVFLIANDILDLAPNVLTRISKLNRWRGRIGNE